MVSSCLSLQVFHGVVAVLLSTTVLKVDGLHQDRDQCDAENEYHGGRKVPGNRIEVKQQREEVNVVCKRSERLPVTRSCLAKYWNSNHHLV